VVVWLRNSLVVLIFMTETSEALSKQTEELTVKKFGDQEVVLGPGFTESNPETVERVQRYKFEKYFPDVNFDDVKNYINDFFQKPKKFIKRQVDEYKFQQQEPEFIETLPEPKMIPTPEFAEGKQKEEPVIDYDTNWYQSDNTINILKNESYSSLYATGEVGQQMGYQLPLGYRTNNWLSQHQLGINWDGLSKTKEDKKILPNFKKETHSVMEVFETPEFGVRAGMVDVMTKALKPASEYNKDTITFKEGKDGSPIITLQKLIDSGYMENADNYIRIGKGLGIDLNTEFNLFNKEEAMKWFDYMLLSEMGTFKNDIPKAERDKVFNSAYDMAMDRMRDESYTYHSTAKKYLDSSQ
jgi:hypothetical protein